MSESIEDKSNFVEENNEESQTRDYLIVGVAGLGLIGGSYAKAFKKNSNARVLGCDRNREVFETALEEGVLDGELTIDNISECDLIIPALYNQAVIDYVNEIAPYVRQDAIVMDTGGLKRRICAECFPIAKKYGFTFFGGHPMAGKKYSGYKYSSSKLFKDASMIVVPEDVFDIETLEKLKEMLAPCNFGRMTICTPDKHDKLIAFTSEMAHIVSNAYIKSPTAREHKGFSAGSYKDMTRVAWLNEDMWTEIFMENKDNLIYELDTIIDYLKEYKQALQDEDSEKLHQILHEGKVAKEEVDGK